MKYIISGLMLLLTLPAFAEKKQKCAGKLKLKVGETFYDRDTRTTFKCDCKEGTGIEDPTARVVVPCEPIMYERKHNPNGEQKDFTPVKE